MLTKVRTLLHQHNLTVGQIAKKSGISRSTLDSTFNRPVQKWSVGALEALSASLDLDADGTLHRLSSEPWSLKINNQKQTIQGYHIVNPADFQEDKFVITNECYESWRPNYNDVRKYVESYHHPNLKAKQSVKKCLKALKSDE